MVSQHNELQVAVASPDDPDASLQIAKMQATNRLRDIIVEEVSLVDRAANKRRFLVIKRDGDESSEGEMNATNPSNGGDEMDSSAEQTTQAAAPVLEGQGVLGFDDVDSSCGQPPTGTLEPGASAVDKALPTGMQAAVMGRLAEVLERLVVAANAVGRSDLEDMTPLVESLVAAEVMLRGVVEDLKAGPMDSSAGQTNATPVGPDGDLELNKSATHPSVVEAYKLLQVAIGKLLPGEPCEADGLDALKKAHELLAPLALTTGPAMKTDEGLEVLSAPGVLAQEVPAVNDGSENTDLGAAVEAVDVQKSGRKMAGKRLEKFREALDVLMGLFAEVLPAEDVAKAAAVVAAAAGAEAGAEGARETEQPDDVEKVPWSTAFVNDLPDSAFLHIESGGTKDDAGLTVPRSLRHFPVRGPDGEIDLPHLRNAIARIPQAQFLSQGDIDKLQAEARTLLDAANEAAAKKAAPLEELHKRISDLEMDLGNARAEARLAATNSALRVEPTRLGSVDSPPSGTKVFWQTDLNQESVDRW